ncbi:MAG: isochorismatase family protein [Synergistaceae bacterium]|jgi:nicotinamidase-related amidase|nr:isochorismatase family protein [Synergistaceae bacterium]
MTSRFCGRLRREETAFLMIDVQERLLPSISGREAVLENGVRLLKTAAQLALPVLCTEQYPKGIGATAAELSSVFPDGTRRFEKMAFCCCDEPDFLEALRVQEREVIVIFGIESHICVLSTVQDLLERGRKVVLAADACGSRSPEHHRLALDAARTCGAAVLPTETVVYQLLGRSGTPDFKALLPLFK